MKKNAKPFQGARCEKRLNEWIKFLDLKDYYIINQNNEDFIARITKAFVYKIPVIALGNIASKRIKEFNVEHFLLPHPSGLNRKLNNKQYEKEQLELCKEWLNK